MLDDRRLSPTARDLIADPAAEILFSAVSAWEIAIKTRTVRLDLPPEVPAFVHGPGPPQPLPPANLQGATGFGLPHRRAWNPLMSK